MHQNIRAFAVSQQRPEPARCDKYQPLNGAQLKALLECINERRMISWGSQGDATKLELNHRALDLLSHSGVEHPLVACRLGRNLTGPPIRFKMSGPILPSSTSEYLGSSSENHSHQDSLAHCFPLQRPPVVHNQ